jgi:SHS2 domain-containing protein
MFELFDHTADLGLRIRAADLNRLFEDAGRALFSAILANPESVRAVEEATFRIEGTRLDDLLVDWLGELLYTFETRKMVFGEFDVRVDESGISAAARGEPIDPGRHQFDMEIKAITYHGLKVEREADGWLAEVIVDL